MLSPNELYAFNPDFASINKPEVAARSTLPRGFLPNILTFDPKNIGSQGQVLGSQGQVLPFAKKAKMERCPDH
jgi:hypothetical protein